MPAFMSGTTDFPDNISPQLCELAQVQHNYIQGINCTDLHWFIIVVCLKHIFVSSNECLVLENLKRDPKGDLRLNILL